MAELSSVRRELARNLELVDAEIESLRRIEGATQALIAALNAAPGAPRVMIPDSLLLPATMWSPTMQPSFGAVDALIASGRLAEVEEPALRLGLAGLKDVFADALEEGVIARDITLEQLTPLTRESGEFWRLRRAVDEFFVAAEEPGLSPQERAVARPFPTHGDAPYPNSRAIRNVLELRLLWYRAGLSEFRAVVSHLDDLIDLVDDEIDG